MPFEGDAAGHHSYPHGRRGPGGFETRPYGVRAYTNRSNVRIRMRTIRATLRPNGVIRAQAHVNGNARNKETPHKARTPNKPAGAGFKPAQAQNRPSVNLPHVKRPRDKHTALT
jgi:hypothetical protein